MATVTGYTKAQADTLLAGAKNALGSPSNPVTDATAPRPSGFTVVYWLCATQPTNWATNDVWTDNS